MLHRYLILVFVALTCLSPLYNRALGLINTNKIIEESRNYADISGKILAKPCSVAGSIPGAALGFFASIPFAIASSAIMPLVYIGSGDFGEAGKSIVWAPIETLAFGSKTGMSCGMVLSATPAYVLGAGFGTATAVAKNIIEHVASQQTEDEEPNIEAVEEKIANLPDDYTDIIKDNFYLSQCEAAISNVLAPKPPNSQDPLIIAQDLEYNISLANDCLQSQLKEFKQTPAYRTYSQEIEIHENSLRAISEQLANLKSLRLNDTARLNRYGDNRHIQDKLLKISKKIEVKEWEYTEQLASLKSFKNEYAEIIETQNQLQFFIDLVIQQTINDSH